MARKTRPARATSAIEKSLRDAQEVLSSYLESGGKQVKDTLSALAKIFADQQFAATVRPKTRSRTRTRTSRSSDGTRRRTVSRRGTGTARPASAKKRSVNAVSAQRGKRTRHQHG